MTLTPVTEEHQLRYQAFLKKVHGAFMQHPIVVHNAYTKWFQQGQADDAELRHFAVQFSVFSNLFLMAQLKKVINSDSLESMHAAKEILANEIGVIFNNRQQTAKVTPHLSEDEKDMAGDPDLVSISGTVDGGIFRFKSAHFEWLLKFGAEIGLNFNDMGKRRHGTASTLFFCDELSRVYGSEESNEAAGASYAIENWAAAGFWQELEDGLKHIKQTRLKKLPIAFFSWHNRVEAQHAEHTQDELAMIYFQPGFDEAKFLAGGREILKALDVFWSGLEQDRQQRENQGKI